MSNTFRQDGRVVYKSDQCLISAEGDQTPRSTNIDDKEAKTMRINIKMVIRCPSASFELEPGLIAPPSTPSEKVPPVPELQKEDLSKNQKQDNDCRHVANRRPEEDAKTSVTTKSAPPGPRVPFGKTSDKTETRILSSKRPPNYVWGLTRQSRTNMNRSKVVLRPFSERSRAADNLYCFTCRRNSNSSRLLQNAGRPELGFFKGKPPLTPFTRLGCYRTQLKTKTFTFPGRPMQDEQTRKVSNSTEECWHVSHSDFPPAVPSNMVGRGSKTTKQRLVSEVIAEKLNLNSSCQNEGEESGATDRTEDKNRFDKEFSYFFVKRRGLVKGFMAPNQQEPIASQDDGSYEIHENKDARQLSPFRRNLQSHHPPARWSSRTATATQIPRQRNTYHGIQDYSALGPDDLTRHKTNMLNRVTLTPFQKRRYCT